jgi:hypothetical protein
MTAFSSIGWKQQWLNLEAELLQSTSLFGLYQQGLVEGEHVLLSSQHAIFQQDKVIGHFTTMDKATQQVNALVRQVIISGGMVLNLPSLIR